MSKPNGIDYGLDKGAPILTVSKITHAQDLIWDAVEQARKEGMTPKQFQNEVIGAWEESAERELEHDLKTFRG